MVTPHFLCSNEDQFVEPSELNPSEETAMMNVYIIGTKSL
jgi:hypothetical protein